MTPVSVENYQERVVCILVTPAAKHEVQQRIIPKPCRESKDTSALSQLSRCCSRQSHLKEICILSFLESTRPTIPSK